MRYTVKKVGDLCFKGCALPKTIIAKRSVCSAVIVNVRPWRSHLRRAYVRRLIEYRAVNRIDKINGRPTPIRSVVYGAQLKISRCHVLAARELIVPSWCIR